MVIQLNRATSTGHAGLAEKQPQTKALALGGEERPTQLFGDGQWHPRAMITNAQAQPLVIPVQANVEFVRTGVGGVVEQIEQRLGEIGRWHDPRWRAAAQALIAVAGLGTHQMPAIQSGFQPFDTGLLHHCLTPIVLGGAHQLLQGVLAQLDLLLQQGQIILQRRLVAILLAQLLEQHAHGAQRRTQLMGGASGLSGHGQQLLVAQAFLTPFGAQFVLAAQLLGHLGDEEGDQRRRQGKAQPHAINQQALTCRGQLERMGPHQQQGVTGQRQAREDDGEHPRQRCRGDGQRHQIIGNEGVGRTARVIQQHAVDDQVAAQLHGVLDFGHRPGATQAHGSTQTQQQRNAEGDRQLQPG